MYNMGDILFQLISIITLILPIAFIVFLFVYVKRLIQRMEKRSDERLQIDQQNTAIQQQQMKTLNDLNVRISNVEKILKEQKNINGCKNMHMNMDSY